MRYSKSLFIAASLLIASTVFAADVPKTRQWVKLSGADLPETAAMVSFAKKGTGADLAREIVRQVNMPTGAEIEWIFLGTGRATPSGPFAPTEDVIYNVDFPFYQPNHVLVQLKMPSLTEMGLMGIVQIKDKLLKRVMKLVVPKNGKVIDIMNAYRKKVTIPENKELFAFHQEHELFLMNENDSYTTEDLNTTRSNLSLSAAWEKKLREWKKPSIWNLSTGWLEALYREKD